LAKTSFYSTPGRALNILNLLPERGPRDLRRVRSCSGAKRFQASGFSTSAGAGMHVSSVKLQVPGDLSQLLGRIQAEAFHNLLFCLCLAGYGGGW